MSNGNKASAGRILIKPRGNYSPDETYVMLDLVNNNGVAYLCKKTAHGIEPSNDTTEYWHNMLDFEEVIRNTMAKTVADDVSDILEERFTPMLSEAKYASDLMENYETPTFVRWNAVTSNTPYTNGLTQCTDGFALVHGDMDGQHTIVAWTRGGAHTECFTHTVVGGGYGAWDGYLLKSGGTLTGALDFNDDGKVFAEDAGVFLESKKDSDNTRKLYTKNPTIPGMDDAVKLIEKKDGVETSYNLFGEHNPGLLSSLGYAKLDIGTFEGGKDRPKLTTKINAQVIIIRLGEITAIFTRGSSYGVAYGHRSYAIYTLDWAENGVEWNCSSFTLDGAINAIPDLYNFNTPGEIYTYFAIGF